MAEQAFGLEDGDAGISFFEMRVERPTQTAVGTTGMARFRTPGYNMYRLRFGNQRPRKPGFQKVQNQTAGIVRAGLKPAGRQLLCQGVIDLIRTCMRLAAPRTTSEHPVPSRCRVYKKPKLLADAESLGLP